MIAAISKVIESMNPVLYLSNRDLNRSEKHLEYESNTSYYISQESIVMELLKIEVRLE